MEIRNRGGNVLKAVKVDTLAGANLSGADLFGADLNGADLSGTNLPSADLNGADLTRADLSGTNLCDADLCEAHLADAILSGADLTRANLTGADLTGAHLCDADLSGANMSGTILSGADVTGAHLWYTVFAGCNDLHEAKGLKKVVHEGPSSLDTHTLRSCVRELSDDFLDGVGYSRDGIDNLRRTYGDGTMIYGDRWEFVKELGEGGQGATCIVVDKKGDGQTWFVLKRLKKTESEQAWKRFEQEINVIRSLDHENIIKLVDANLEDKQPYYVSEHCAGGSLEDWLKRAGGSVDRIEALTLFEQVCAGLSHALVNGHKIVHRDIKPANILLKDESGPAVVADWGICNVENAERLTLTKEVVGARFFTDPLLEEGRFEGDVPPLVDVYSLGKLLYWLMSGGRIIPREDFRDAKWNLIELSHQDDKLEHVNRVLDDMITLDMNRRLKSAIYVAEDVRELIRVLKGGYNVVSPKIHPLCSYCGKGRYRLVAKSDNDTIDVRKFGLGNPQGSDWRVLACSHCGHVQLFRVDMADRQDWWK